MYQNRAYFENSGSNWSKRGTCVDKHHILHLINGDFSFWPMPLVSSVKDQSELAESLLVGGQCLDRVMLCLKPSDLNDVSLKLTKYLMFPNSHFSVKV